MTKATPNFAILASSRSDIAVLMVEMLQACDAVSRRSWSHPQEPAAEEWWADVLADPRARRWQQRAPDVKRACYSLGDENHEIIFVACSKCEWKAAFERAELIAVHGRDCIMPDLVDHLAAPGCVRIGNQWDRCGAYYVNPLED